MAQLPQISEPLMTKWKSILDPIIANPVNNSLLLPNVSLSAGVNVINHKLGRMMQGWIISDINGVSTVYRSAAYNILTLSLTSSAPVTISLVVF